MSIHSTPPALMAINTESTDVSELQQTPASEETLATFCVSRGYSPPQDTRLGETLLSSIQAKANVPLKLIGKTWENLDGDQQVKLAFLIIHQQDVRLHEYFQRHTAVHAAEYLYHSLDEQSDVGTRLHAIIRKGGDISIDNGTIELDSFLSSHPEWRKNADAPTIFNNPDEQRRLEPLFRFQGESPICYLMAAANLIHYSISLGNDREQSHESRVNVNRFMRNTFTDDEIFHHVYDGEGGSVFDHLGRLLKPSNPGPEVELYWSISIKIRDGVDFVYRTVTGAIRDYGALLIPDFKLIPAFANNNGKTRFSCHDFTEQAIRESTNSHSVLVVGVRTTEAPDECGGLEFLIQNSWSCKPFVVVGYDVLLAMKVERLWALAPGLKFDPGANRVEFAARTYHSGSPLDRLGSISFLTSDENHDAVCRKLAYGNNL